MDNSWTNGSYTIAQHDVDTVCITNHIVRKKGFIHGGDLEGILSALIESYNLGRRNEIITDPPSFPVRELMPFNPESEKE